MAISKERIREIAHLTIGQRDNPLWQQYRKNRFTASQFGKILNSYFSDEDRSWYSDFVILRKELLGNKPIPRSPPLVWGEQHEHLAIQEYEKKTGNKVEPTGIWVFPNAYFGASPDGIVYDPKDPTAPIAVLEVKCPWRLRNIQITQRSDWNSHLDYLDRWNNLVTSHPYYHQIQGELIATKLEYCEFVVWCPSGILVTSIKVDMKWQKENITLLERIYKKCFVREEDLEFLDYRRNPEMMQEIKLGDILSLTNIEKRRIYRTLIFCLAIHLARWNKKLSLAQAGSKSTEELWEENLIESKKVICQTCLVKLLLWEWKNRHRNEDFPEEIIQIQNCKWEIPTSIMSLAEKRAKSICVEEYFNWEPCMCVKV